MSVDRRRFLQVSAGAAGAGLVACARPGETPPATLRPDPFSALPRMTEGVVPISIEERNGRIEKARALMIDSKIDAIYLEAGTGLFYFTGVRWGASERMFAAVLPARGEVAYVCPKFEEGRAREQITIGTDIRTWEEDENPADRVAQILRDRRIGTGTIGMEERVRFFLFDNIRKAAPALRYVSADPITIACRIIKSPAEIALM